MSKPTAVKSGALNKQLRQLALLQEANRLIASDDTTENVLESILHQLIDHLGYTAIQIYQLSSSSRDIWLYLELGHGSKPVTQTVDIFSIDEHNIVSDAARNGEPVYVPDINTAPYSYYISDEDEVLIGSELALPLKFGPQTLGVLRVQAQTINNFAQADIDFLNCLSGLVAAAIRNNRKISQLEDSIEEIKTLYTLNYRDNLEQKQGRDSAAPTAIGFEYDGNQINPTDKNTPLTIDQEPPEGVVTRQDNGVQALVAPIKLYGETIGMLGLENISDGIEAAWNLDDINMVEEISSQVALAIENARLLQQTQEQSNQLSLLFEATRQLGETIDLEQIYRVLTSQVANYVDANRCSVLLLNNSHTHFETQTTTGRDQENNLISLTESRAVAIEEHPSLRQMLKNPRRAIQHINDPNLHPNTRRMMTARPGQTTYTLTRFPLIVRGKLIGLLEVEHHQKPHQYTTNQLQLAQAIISQVSVSIENAQLFQQTQTALKDTQKLYKISQRLVESTNVQEVFDVILETVKSYEVDRVSISLIDRSPRGDIDSVTIAASWDRDPAHKLSIGTTFSAQNFSLVKTFAEPPFSPLISQDLRRSENQDNRMDNAFRLYALNKLSARTLFSAPMFLGAEYKGVISIYTRKAHVYSSPEISVYQTLADQAIIAIENYRLLEATRLERDRASLLYQLGQMLGNTTSVQQVQQAVLDFFSKIGANEGEIYITDGADFVSIGSTIPARQTLSSAEMSEIIMTGGHESLALSNQNIIEMARDEVLPDQWPLQNQEGLEEIEVFACVPFYSQRSTLQGVISFFQTNPEGFTKDQLATFESVAIQTAASLENVWLLQQTSVVLYETELLYNATRGFNSAQNIEDLLEVISDNFGDIGIDIISIGLISSSSSSNMPRELSFEAMWRKEENIIVSQPFTLSVEQYDFIKQLRPNKNTEIHYRTLSEQAQAHLAEQLPAVRVMTFIPLLAGPNWLGVLLLASHNEAYDFKVKTINQIATLAGQAAMVVQNLELIEETQKTLYNAEILSNLGQQLLVADSEETIYDLALSAVSATKPDRGVSIFMYDQISETEIEMELMAVWDNPRREWPSISVGSRLSTEELDLVPLLKTGDTVVSQQALMDERFSDALRQLLMMMQIKAMVAVPIWLRKDVEGFMLIGNESDQMFAPEDIRLYEEISREISEALENRRLLNETQHRAWQLQTAAEISQAVTGYLDLETLLTESVELIKDQLNFYHVTIFLVDEYQRYAIARASTGEVGQEMLAMKHKLEVGGRSLVGAAITNRQPRIALDISQEAINYKNPLLPKTRSQMALPLISQGRITGALDVQSAKPNTFGQSETTILQSMANQLANAIEAARSYQESHEALQEVSRIHQRYVNDQWRAFLSEKEGTVGFKMAEDGHFDEMDLQQPLLSDNAELLAARHPQIISTQPQTNGHQQQDPPPETEPAEEKPDRLISPLVLNGESVIGAVDFDLPESMDEDMLDDDLLRIVEAVSTQAAQAIEAARLYEQSQIAREEAEALYEVGRSLVAAANEQEMFDTVLGKMLAVLGLRQGGVLLFNDDRVHGKLYSLYKDGQPVEADNTQFPISNNLSYEKLIETKKPVAIYDMETSPLVAKVREMGLTLNIASLLLVPIIINDAVIGALGADSVGRHHNFTQREKNLAMAMADQLSIALLNRRLIEETRRRAVLLQTSADVGRVASSILEPDEMQERATQLIKDRFGFAHVQIFLMDEENEYARLHTSTSAAGQALLADQYRLKVGSRNVIGQTLKKRQPVVVRSTDTLPTNLSNALSQFLPDTQAELGIPLQVGITPVGVLDVQSIQSDAFSDEDISTLETLGAQVAVAIQNAQAFREQQETAQRLKEIDKLKTQFLANMSHELRTPLNSIIGFSRVILKGIDGPLTDLQKTDLTSIHNSGQHLLGLINNILDLSKIEAGKMELNFEETEIEPIIKTVMSTAIALVKDKPVELKQELPENPPIIWADPTRVRQVVLNLVSNACKFTEEGTVTTRVTIEKDRAIFSVRDTGIGISQEQMPHVFEEFTQVDASTTRKAGGTGLGLPISRHFVEMHHGEIWVDSVPGQGSTFSFYIPIEPPSEEPDEPDDTDHHQELPDTTKKLVVAIDDDKGVIDLYRRYLGTQNYEIIGVTQGKKALAQVKQHEPFAILLDIMIPDKDGWNIIKELKNDPFTHNIPVIICSIVSDKNRGFSLGATNYLVKPIVELDLIEALKQLNNYQDDDIKVLVVDDKADDVLLIRRILEARPNYAVVEASNGLEGLELIKKQLPDLIILDLNMPQMDGFAMLEELKKNDQTRNIPIIVVSAEEISVEEQNKLTDQVEVLLRKGIFTEKELLADVGQALKHLQQQEHTPG